MTIPDENTSLLLIPLHPPPNPKPPDLPTIPPLKPISQPQIYPPGILHHPWLLIAVLAPRRIFIQHAFHELKGVGLTSRLALVLRKEG